MQDVGNFSDTVAVLACALGCGLLRGIERERRKGSGPGRGPAGIRTFSIASLAGGVAAVLGSAPLVVVGAVFVAALPDAVNTARRARRRRGALRA